ncbi:MAG: hypothetical protein MUE96_08470 [Bacteroidia bacterium]|nr:hypothetical protein [Bacteroidia bacterium]
MKSLFTFCFVLLYAISNAQVFRNCRLVLEMVRTDSVVVTAESREGLMEVNSLTGELTIKVKISSFKTTDSTVQSLFKQNSDKLILKGYLGVDPIAILKEARLEQQYPFAGMLKLNQQYHGVQGQFSLFKQSNQEQANQNALLSFALPFTLADYKLDQTYPMIQDKVMLRIVRQPFTLTTP